jgi:hypothetical protein
MPREGDRLKASRIVCGKKYRIKHAVCQGALFIPTVRRVSKRGKVYFLDKEGRRFSPENIETEERFKEVYERRGLMAKEKKTRAKPTIEADIDCPHCGEKINVRHFRKRVNPSVKAEYRVMTEVKTQDQLALELGDPDDPDTKVAKK